MNVLDENIPADVRPVLRKWRIRVKQIGVDIGNKGMKDQNQVLPLLHSLRRPVLFTLDLGFYHPRFAHQEYGLVCLDIADDEVADFVRRLLRHAAFKTKAKRMGVVALVGEAGIRVRRRGENEESKIDW